MSDPSFLNRAFLRSPSTAAVSYCIRSITSDYYHRQTQYSTIAAATATTNDSLPEDTNNEKRKPGKWFTLPPFTKTVDGSTLGKDITERRSSPKCETNTTALKWVNKCCPELPRSLVQKLFRLRQVRRESSTYNEDGVQAPEGKIRRVAAEDTMQFGDRIHLPISVQELHSEKAECRCTDDEVNYLHSLELYKDQAIIVINKPPGMPVQGGSGIHLSLDELAGTYLRHEYAEPPRLVHRLDRDSSGVLVMGRTQLSATVLHSIFREKTFGASDSEPKSEKRFLQRRYWALVLGSPRRSEGLISVPLGKVVMDDGKSERITVVDNARTMPSQHAITAYRVMDSNHGYTWLELSPLTGRKHQLRVHCAEVLGTPIVGDYKYGWQAHRKWKLLPSSNLEGNVDRKVLKPKTQYPFGLDLQHGSISEKQPSLHLHCREMVMPDVSLALQQAHSSPDYDFADIKSLKFVAPLPTHMKTSWDMLSS